MSKRKPRKVGAPSKFTPERVAIIIKTLKAGNYRKIAAEYAGASYPVFNKWMRIGEQGKDPIFVKFRADVLAAEREAEIRCVQRVVDAAAEDWKAAGWWLERKNHARWGKKDQIKHSGEGAPGSGSVKVVIVPAGATKPPDEGKT